MQPALVQINGSRLTVVVFVQCPVYHSRWKLRWFVKLVLFLSLGSQVKGHHLTPQLPRATAAMLLPATAVMQHVFSMICCVASITPSLLELPMRHVAVLEALLCCWTQVESKFRNHFILFFHPEYPNGKSTCLSPVPCVPQQVTTQMVCTNDTGIVSWEETEGVSSYMVQAFGPNGHKTLCNSTTSSCNLPSLHCGQLYNLTVTAQDGGCNSSHANQTLQSGLFNVWDKNVNAMVNKMTLTENMSN